MPTLKNWALVNVMGDAHLEGEVYDDPTREDGTHITTTRVVSLVDPENSIVKTFSGSNYKLDTVNEDYEKAFPNARQRVIECLTKLKQMSLKNLN